MLLKENMKDGVIQYADGVRHFAGNEKMYEKYLKRFSEDAHFADAKKAMADQDLHEVLEQTHALKGIAGTLGMTQLFDAANAVVTAIRQEHPEQVAELMEQLEAAQKTTVEKLSGCLAD